MYSDIDSKKKTKKTHRKWKVTEILRILEFIQGETEFEKPSAQVYYKRFLEQVNMDATWDLIRWKVRYLRITFKKAEDWRKSTDAKLLEAEEGNSSVKEKLKKLCPYYEHLLAIFGETHCNRSYEAYDSETKSSRIPSSVNETLLSLDGEYSLINVKSPLSIKNEPNSPLEPELNNIETPERVWGPAAEAKYSFDHQQTEVKTERIELQRIKIDFQTKKFSKEMEVYERKLRLKEMQTVEEIERRKEEMDIRKKELALRKLEIEQDERLRRLEIEKQERVEKYEIEMRYKYAK